MKVLLGLWAMGRLTHVTWFRGGLGPAFALSGALSAKAAQSRLAIFSYIAWWPLICGCVCLGSLISAGCYPKTAYPFYRRDINFQEKDRKLRCFGAALFWLSYGWFCWNVIDLILITMLVVKVRSYGRKSEYGLHFGLRLRQNFEIFLLGLFGLIGKLPFFCFPG